MNLMEIFAEDCSYNDIEGMKRCMDKGADINKNTLEGSSTHWARTPQALQLLLDNGAQVNTLDEFGLNAMMSQLQFYEIHHAWDSSPNIKLKYLTMLEIMVKTDVYINHQCKSGFTALMMAPDIEFAQILIENGADPTITDNDGLMAFQHYRSSDNLATSAFLENAALKHKNVENSDLIGDITTTNKKIRL